MVGTRRTSGALALVVALCAACFGILPQVAAMPASAAPVAAAAEAAPTLDPSDVTVFLGAHNPSSITTGADGNLWIADENEAITRVTPTGAATRFRGPGITAPREVIAGPDGTVWFSNWYGGPVGRITSDGVSSIVTTTTAWQIAPGPDGNVWIVNDGGIGRVTPSGVVTMYPVDTLGIIDLAAGPGGALWFTRYGTTPGLGKLTTAGAVTFYPSVQGSQLVHGPDGYLWVSVGAHLEKVSAQGVVVDTYYDLTANTVNDFTFGLDGMIYIAGGYQEIMRLDPLTRSTSTTGPAHPDIGDITDLVAGPDGNVWFVDVAESFGHVSPSLEITHLGERVTSPGGMTAGPDGKVWFVNHTWGRVGNVTTDGVYSNVHRSTMQSLTDIVAGPDGNLWYTDTVGSAIGRVSPDGASVTRFASVNYAMPRSIAAGPDGNLWFTNWSSKTIGRITPSGAGWIFALPGVDRPNDLTVGPDGALWFTNGTAGLGRITTGGAVTLFPSPLPTGYNKIVAGADGGLWFSSSNQIGRAGTDGVVTDLVTVAPEMVSDLVAGPDGNVWFTAGDLLGAITPDGEVATVSTPDTLDLTGITVGPDGDIWFASSGRSSIGRLDLVAVNNTVSGVVTDGDNGVPAAGLEVRLYREPGRVVVANRTTAGDGSYAFAGLEDGSYRVRVSDPVSGAFRTEFWHDAYAYGAASPVNVTGGQTATVDVTVARPTAIEGTVTDADTGQPVPGIEVRLYREPGRVVVGNRVTGADGSYRFDDPGPGSYRARFRDPGGAYRTEYHADATSYPLAAPILVGAGQTVGVDAQLSVPGQISGVVTDAVTGSPVPGIEVRLYREPGRVAVANATTDALGAYVFSPVVAGTYRVRFADPVGGAYVTEFWDDASTYPTGDDLTLVAGGAVVASAALAPAS